MCFITRKAANPVNTSPCSLELNDRDAGGLTSLEVLVA